MNSAIKISAVVITYNEEANIRRCLDSLVPVADEIVVMDSFSTDRTKEICSEYNLRFLENRFDGHIQQKNHAMEQAAHDVILSLDADEALTPELQASILEAKKYWRQDACRIARLTSYCGHWIHHCGWYPGWKIRLWDRRKGRWGGVNPHDTVIMKEGSVINKMEGDLLHYTYHTLGEHLTQMNKFSAIAAREAHKRGKKVNTLWHLVCYPAFTFLRNYILKRGFLDGYYGFIVCKNSAYYRFLKYSKLAELNKGKEI